MELTLKKYISTERANLFEPNVYISMVVELGGKLQAGEVYDAVEVAYTKNEATVSRIVLEDDGTAYYERMEQSGCKVFYDQRAWQTILQESEKKPFELWNGEFIRTYINCSDRSATIFIMAHHLVGDGKAMVCFTHELLQILEGETVAFQTMNLIDAQGLIKNSTIAVPFKGITQYINRKWRKVGKTFGWEDYLKIHNTYWASKQSCITIDKYDDTEISKMKEFSKNNGITLNSQLVTYLAYKNQDCKVFGIPISIRGNHDTTMSNQTSGITISHVYKKNQLFEVNGALIHKKIYKRIQKDRIKYFILLYIASLEPSLIDAVLLESQKCYSNKISRKLATYMGYLGKYYTDLGITNLTTIDISKKFSNFKVKNIYFIPPKVSYAKNIVGIATFHNKLSMVHHNMNVPNKSESTSYIQP